VGARTSPGPASLLCDSILNSMGTNMPRLRLFLLCLILGFANASSANGLQAKRQAKQTPEVMEAYRVCQSFERLLGENLDFARAYEATFTRNTARRRAIAIADGEFGVRDSAGIADALLIKAYKLRMQIFYLTIPLAGPGDEEATLFFPPHIKEILQREAPRNPREFPAYVSQLEHDAASYRSHLERLAANYPSVAERVGRFKTEALSASFEPPTEYKVEPINGYYRSGVLGTNEMYYEINGYIVARDQGRMRIVGIRFFNRLF
jgi:hypothetical protein